MKTIPQIAADFDAIAAALATGSPRTRLSPAEASLLAHVPAHAKRALDVGCGDGVVARALAARGIHVLGIDVSPGMIELARARSPRSLPIEYQQVDVMSADLSLDRFDVVVSVAVLHHLPLDVIVPRLASLVAPGGTLLLQDVMDRRGLLQLPINATAVLARGVRELITRSRVPSRVTATYQLHGAGERYLDVSVVAGVYRALLPSARVYVHLEWRYSVVWQRPSDAVA